MNKDMFKKKCFELVDFVVFDTISHQIINKYLKKVLYQFILQNIHTFEEVRKADPKLSYVNYR